MSSILAVSLPFDFSAFERRFDLFLPGIVLTKYVQKTPRTMGEVQTQRPKLTDLDSTGMWMRTAGGLIKHPMTRKAEC